LLVAVAVVDHRLLPEVWAAGEMGPLSEVRVLPVRSIRAAAVAVVKLGGEEMEGLGLLLLVMQILLQQLQAQPEVQPYLYQVDLEHIFSSLEADQLLGDEQNGSLCKT
jgi:hypothetical protein